MKTALSDSLLYDRKREKDHRHRCMLRYDVLFSPSLNLFRFFVLVFHLKQKHEEGQRLLHYLQQTNTALATGTLIYLIIQVTCGNEIKGPQC
jgi:hypothetical protein